MSEDLSLSLSLSLSLFHCPLSQNFYSTLFMYVQFPVLCWTFSSHLAKYLRVKTSKIMLHNDSYDNYNSIIMMIMMIVIIVVVVVVIISLPITMRVIKQLELKKNIWHIGFQCFHAWWSVFDFSMLYRSWHTIVVLNWGNTWQHINMKLATIIN
jgi:hypothetical protein